MTLEQVINKFQNHPVYMGMGAGKLSRQWKCSREDIYTARKIVRSKKKTGRLPKILIFDIETAASIVYAFNRWNENIGLEKVIQDPYVLTWSAKWLYSTEVLSDRCTPEEAIKADDRRIVKSLWNLLNEADMTVAHYGDNYDTPWMNSRFIIHGLNPPNVVSTIDTKKIASKYFKFPSNKLDALAGYFGLGGKIKTSFSLWSSCMQGNQQALIDMNTYCDQDVRVLEEVYLKLRPYIKGHPNVGLYLESDVPVCPNCGSKHLHQETQDYYTPTGRYSVYRCECGALSRCRTHNMDKEKRQVLVTSVGK